MPRREERLFAGTLFRLAFSSGEEAGEVKEAIAIEKSVIMAYCRRGFLPASAGGAAPRRGNAAVHALWVSPVSG